jgi:FkbM family methyltransferase
LDVRVEGAYWLGTYDRWIFDRVELRDYLRPGDTAWDCGSYIGYYAAAFRHVVGTSGQVHAFEASILNYGRARWLPDLNHWPNVQVHYLAIGPDHRLLQFVNNGGGMAGPYGLTKTFPNFDHLDMSTVECAGVDELVYERHIPAPDFIKFDLESAEEYALMNGDRLFREKRPVILLEIHGDRARQVTGEFLARYDYVGRLLGLEPSDVVHGPNDLAAFTYEWYTMLCTPRERSPH